MTDAELRSHPEWRNFGREVDRHPPIRGWLMAPLIGSDGENYGSLICRAILLAGPYQPPARWRAGRARARSQSRRALISLDWLVPV
jgi:hypothetical protein